jgi:glycosyltransferase involved in cell wall biosynthesis
VKIAWFTPFSCKSAIARASAGVVAELAKLAEVHLCHFETSDIRDTPVAVKRFTSAAVVDDRTLEDYDLVIYNFGNYLQYHREIFHVSRRWPGVCILHDIVMHHFFAAYYLEDLRSPAAYSLLMERLYGDDGAAAAARSLGGEPVWESDDVGRFPLFEEVVQGALGVVTHSEFFRQRVAANYIGPTKRIPLTYDADTSSPVLSRAQLGVPEGRILMVTVGHVNTNKRIEAVIEAIGKLGPTAQRVFYAVLGPAPAAYKRTLEAAVRRNRLEDSVKFLGQTPDDILRAHLFHADICVNLRYPATEGASASAIEEMLFGKPVIVTDTGFYGELPDDCVAKIDPAREDNLASVLARLVADPALRSSLGAAAQRFAQSEFRAARYAKEIMDFAWEVRAARPLLTLADRVARECYRMGVAGDMPIVGSVAREMGAIFGRKNT